MRDMLKALFYGELDAMALSIRETSQYKRLAMEVTSRIDAFCGNNTKLREQTSSLMSSLEEHISLAFFSLGARWGAQMMLALMQECDDTFKSLEDNDHD